LSKQSYNIQDERMMKLVPIESQRNIADPYYLTPDKASLTQELDTIVSSVLKKLDGLCSRCSSYLYTGNELFNLYSYKSFIPAPKTACKEVVSQLVKYLGAIHFFHPRGHSFPRTAPKVRVERFEPAPSRTVPDR
jgi:hypothetical protein